MSLSAPNAITTALVEAAKKALGRHIPTPTGTIPGNVSDVFVAVTEQGEPPPLANGEWFIGVHKDPASQNTPSPGGRTTYTDEIFTAQVTFSKRVSRYGSDRVASAGYPDLQEKIRLFTNYMANNAYSVLEAINAELDLDETNGFIEPFIVANPSPQIQKRGRNWYKGKNKASTQATLAVSATLRLEGLRRIQATGGVN